jgi:hypothetical protein
LRRNNEFSQRAASIRSRLLKRLIYACSWFEGKPFTAAGTFIWLSFEGLWAVVSKSSPQSLHIQTFAMIRSFRQGLSFVADDGIMLLPTKT